MNHSLKYVLVYMNQKLLLISTKFDKFDGFKFRVVSTPSSQIVAGAPLSYFYGATITDGSFGQFDDLANVPDNFMPVTPYWTGVNYYDWEDKIYIQYIRTSYDYDTMIFDDTRISFNSRVKKDIYVHFPPFGTFTLSGSSSNSYIYVGTNSNPTIDLKPYVGQILSMTFDPLPTGYLNSKTSQPI